MDTKRILELKNNFDQILNRIEQGVLDGSMSATLEDRADYRGVDGSRCSVRVFERYSYMGGNRVSMAVTLLGSGEELFLTAITSGGSQAVLFKVNTWGEEAFLDTLRGLLDRLN